MAMHTPLFTSYVLGGFECAHVLVNEPRHRMDMLRDTGHDTRCREDYALLKDAGITTVREGFAWHEIDRGGGDYNFARFEPMLAAGRDLGIQQIWDLTHFDVPEDIDAFSPDIVPRFAAYAVACLRKLREYDKGTLYLVPVNEINFFAFIGGAVGNWAPFGIDRGMQWKRQLIRMTIAAIDAIREIDDNVRFIQVEPNMRRLANEDTPVKKALEFLDAAIQYQPFDMLCGRLEPELGGDEKYLDIIGLNYYPSSQEFIVAEDGRDYTSHETINFLGSDWVPLSELIKDVHDRYGRQIIISETGAWGDLRVPWWTMLFAEVEKAREAGVPLEGVCAYPVIDRPDWFDGHLTNSGLWDFEENDATKARIPYQPVLDAIEKYLKMHR